MILELEADETYEAERKACRIINYDWRTLMKFITIK